MTAQQQQQTSPPTVSTLAHHAFNLYRECVGAGQWAKVVFEQRPEGEHITFSSRPPSAAAASAAAAAKGRRQRKPNKNRLEKLKLRRQLRSQQQKKPAQQQQEKSSSQPQQALSRQLLEPCVSQLQAQSPAGLYSQQQPAAAARTRKKQPQSAATSSNSWQQQQQANAAVKALVSAGTYCTVAAPPQPAAAIHLSEQPPQVQPAAARETRATKKRKAACSPSFPPDNSGIPQLDGEDDGLMTLSHQPFKSPSTSEPARSTLPPPPPWSQYLPSGSENIICKICLINCHFIRRFSVFDWCSSCFLKKLQAENASPE